MAGRIPDSFLDELVSRSDIVEIINARVPLKKAGREYKACCPFHSEKSPSFSVSAEKQFYHCFGCGAHGTVIGFLMQYEKMDFLDAVADLAQRAGLELPREAQGPKDPGSGDLYELLLRAARFFEQNLADNARARQYLEASRHRSENQREIRPGICARLLGCAAQAVWRERRGTAPASAGGPHHRTRSGAASASAGIYDRFRDRLMFPIRDSRGRVIGFGGRMIDQGEPKYLNSPETPCFTRAASCTACTKPARRARISSG